MPAPRTLAAVVLAAVAVGLVGAQLWQGRAEPGAGRPAEPGPSLTTPPTGLTAQPTSVLATALPIAPMTDAASNDAAATGESTEPGSGYLEAARVLRLFCRLVDSRRLAQAEALLVPGAWSHRELLALDHLTFISARVYAAPDARSLVMLTRVHVHLRAPSPLEDGVVTLFFTLGRVGTATGGWQIAAVSTSP